MNQSRPATPLSPAYIARIQAEMERVVRSDKKGFFEFFESLPIEDPSSKDAFEQLIRSAAVAAAQSLPIHSLMSGLMVAYESSLKDEEA